MKECSLNILYYKKMIYLSNEEYEFDRSMSKTTNIIEKEKDCSPSNISLFLKKRLKKNLIGHIYILYIMHVNLITVCHF